MVLFLVGMYDCSERIQQVVERVLLIDTDLIYEFVQPSYRNVVFFFVVN